MINRLDSEKIYKMMDNMLTGVAFVAAGSGRMELLYMNDGGFRMLGYKQEMAEKYQYAVDPISVVLEEDRQGLWQAVDDVVRERRAVDIQVRAVSAAGSLRWLWLRGNLYEKDEDKAVILCTFLDVTDRRAAQESVRMQAELYRKRVFEEEAREKEKLDALTGWYNAEETRSRIDRALEVSKDSDIHAFILVDMNSFWHINETLGKEIGDRLLMDITKKIERRRNRSDILGRVSKDEFVIFIRSIGAVSNLDRIADEIARSTEVTLGSGEESLTVSGSVGVSVYPYQGDSWSDLFLIAKRAVSIMLAGEGERYHIYNLSGLYKIGMTESEMAKSGMYDEVNAGINLEDLLEQILCENRQSMSQLRAIMKIVTRHYGFHRAYLSTEGSAGNPGVEFEYCSQGYGQTEERGGGRKWVTLLKQWDMLDGFRIVRNYDDIPEELSSYMIRNKIYTMLIQPVMRKGKAAGAYIMGECSGREWNLTVNTERELRRILQLIQMCISRYERQQSGMKTFHDSRVLNDFDSYVMAVDYDTYELYFANRKLLDTLPDLKIGDCCYHAFAGRDTPCDACIMRGLDRHDPHAKSSEEQFNAALRSWLKIHASWLQNNGDNATCLLNCIDISEYFLGESDEEDTGFDWSRI